MTAKPYSFIFCWATFPILGRLTSAIRKLTPGGWLRCDSERPDRRGTVLDFARGSRTASPGLSELEASEYVRNAFDQAVKMRLIADVPVGAFLSGGIDSTLGGGVHGDAKPPAGQNIFDRV